MTAVLAFTIAAVVTFLLRSSMTVAGVTFASPRVRAQVALVSPAVLTAMIASALFLDHAAVLVWPSAGEALAIGSAALAVRKTGNAAVAMAVGLPVYWLSGALGWA